MAKIMVLADVVRAHSNGRLLAFEFEKQGHEVLLFNRQAQFRTFKERFNTFTPDLILDASHYHCLDYLEWVKETSKTPIVFWYPDVYFLYTNFNNERENTLRTFEVCDLFITTMKGHVADSRSYTDKVVWFPHFFSNDYYKGNVERAEFNFKYDVMFVGNAHPASPQRGEYIQALLDAGLKVAAYGEPWGPKVFQGHAIANAYAQSIIGLQIGSRGKYEKELQFSVRTFHILGCGAFCLHERVEGMEQLFNDGIHLVQYEGVEDLVTKAVYYVEHGKEREKIAMQGQREVFKHHLISQRVSQFLAFFKEKGLLSKERR